MQKDICKVLVANRGEIAVRIIRAARELGIETVLGCSVADEDSLAARMADEVVTVGPAVAARSYLDIPAVVAAAKQSGADSVHPGYGFLSENAAFAQAVVDAGLTFVGPSPRAIALMGDKAQARLCAANAGVPTVPGSDGVMESLDAALDAAREIGYPVMLKAAAGGGGRGIRVAADAQELAAQYAVATREAQSAFGHGGLYLERFIGNARHIEVQILADGERAIHLFERECSLQRRRQKLLEEAPAPSLGSDARARICASAVALAESVAYRGVGTVEYLYDADRSEFFFIEMNTRVQVEHPVTEMVTGVDIVRESFHLAAGKPLHYVQTDIALRGAAIECRINAEDPQKNFMPAPGTVSALRLPAGPGVRVDTHLYDGYHVPPYYDSLLAKVVVWDTSREHAIGRMKRALSEFSLDGLRSTKGLHLALLDDPAVRGGEYHTAWLEKNLTRIVERIAH